MTKKTKTFFWLVLVVAVSVSIIAVLSHRRTITSGDVEVKKIEKEVREIEKEDIPLYTEEGEVTEKGEKFFLKIDELCARKKTPPKLLKRFASKRTSLFKRHLIAEIIGENKDPAAVDTLLKVLKDKSDNSLARADAARTLGIIGDKRAIEPLIKALEEDKEIQEEVVYGLSMFKDERIIEPLLGVLKSENFFIRLQIARTLNADNSKINDALIDLAKNDLNEYVRAAALRSLGATKSEEAFQLLMNILQDGSRQEKIGAIEALGKMGDRRAVEPLIKILEGDNLDIYAAKALGNIGDKRALVPLMKKMGKNKNEEWIMKHLNAAYKKLTGENNNE